jgi:adenylate kinase
MNKIAIVTGTPGAGKSTIVEKIAKEGNYNVVSIGTEMLKIAENRGLTNDRDNIRKLKSSDINEMRLKVFDTINRMEGNIIIDSHASVKNGNRYIPGFSFQELDALESLTAFVYIDSTAHEILLRRAIDNSRNRDIETMDEIDQQREINLGLISSYASHKNVPIYIIRNEQNKLEGSIESARNTFNNIFSGER